jgi:hypothetical protein
MSKAATALVVVLAAAGLAALSTASCSVHRLSDGYACNPAGTGSECGSGRFCDQGFCVEGGSTEGCPGQCTTCDVEDKTCRIECNAGNPCSNVQCPAGYDCTIRCSNSGACGIVDCAQAHSCDIDCSGSAACGPLNCGLQECSIRCAGMFACPLIDCAASCKCDVTCNNVASCPSMECPTALGPCTEQGSAGATCDSSQPGCDVCL